MPTKTKLSITWVETILIALLVVIGFGLWILVSGQVEARLKLGEPVKEYEINTPDVVKQKAQLELLQSEVAALNGEIAKQKLAIRQSESQIQSLLAIYPSLKTQTGSEIYPADTLTTYWDLQVKTDSLNTQVRELETQIKALIDQKSMLSVKQNQMQAGSADFETTAEQITYVDTQRDKLTEKSLELKLSLLEQQAQVQTMEKLYPKLVQFSLTSNTNPAPEDIAQTFLYLDALANKTAAGSLLKSLEAEASLRQADLVEASTSLDHAQEEAQTTFNSTQKAYQEKMERLSWLWAALGILVYFGLLFLIYRLMAPVRKAYPRHRMLLAIMVPALLLLVVYQEFQVTGVALVGLLAALALAGYIAPKSADPASGPASQTGNQP